MTERVSLKGGENMLALYPISIDVLSLSKEQAVSIFLNFESETNKKEK